LEARQAGHRPKITPTATEKENASKIDPMEIFATHPATVDMSQAMETPTIIPSRPPAKQISTASIKNWMRISRFCAGYCFFRPLDIILDNCRSRKVPAAVWGKPLEN
jgi:hypothetical protein